MFTGLIRHQGHVRSLHEVNGLMHLLVSSDLASEVQHGQSISVNGCCLTVVSTQKQEILFHVSHETIKCTAKQSFAVGRRVNLEKCLAAGELIDGHLVLGHVDESARVISIAQLPSGWDIWFKCSASLGSFIAVKGSVCLDGVSLTVSGLKDAKTHTEFGVTLIPVTLAATSLGALKEDDEVNLEIDVIARYVQRTLARQR